MLHKRRMIDYGWKLVVIADENDALQPTRARTLGRWNRFFRGGCDGRERVNLLQKHGNERFHLEHLRCLFHDKRVVVEAQADESPPIHGSMRAGHGYNAGLFSDLAKVEGA